MAVKVYFNRDFLRLAVEAVKAASSTISVMMYEWAWYEGQRTGTIQDLNRELCIAAKRKVKVKVLLHNEVMGRHLGRINRKTATHLRKAGCEVKMMPMQRPIHAKVWIFDRKTAMVGSHNISSRSVTRNVEAGCVVSDVSEVSAVCDVFDKLWESGIGNSLGGPQE